LQEIGATHPFGRVVDILMGGGRCFFTPQNTTSSCRKDNVDALALARKLGYNVFEDRATFDKDIKLPYLGLFTQGTLVFLKTVNDYSGNY
jgi:alkaline phosphatase